MCHTGRSDVFKYTWLKTTGHVPNVFMLFNTIIIIDSYVTVWVGLVMFVFVLLAEEDSIIHPLLLANMFISINNSLTLLFIASLYQLCFY